MLKKLIMVLLLLILLASVLVGGMVVYAQIKEARIESADIPKTGTPYNPGDFIVNIGNNKYLKASFVVEVKNKKDLDFMSKNNHRVRDGILEILRSLTEKDIRSEDIQNELKKEITECLKKNLAVKSIIDVYFTEFVIQA